MYAGGIWKGDVLIADLEELETKNAAEIYSKRLNAKEVIFPKENGKFKMIFLENHKGLFPQPQDLLPDAGEAINDFWSTSGNFIYRHHVEPRVKLYSPREESFPIPLKYIDVSRTSCTNLDVKQEKRIDDYWNVGGSRDLSDYWTSFTQFTLLEQKRPDGYMWSRRRLTRKQVTSQARSSMARVMEVNGKERQAEGEAKVV